MKKQYFLTVILSLFINVLLGQFVSKENYENAVDKLNCLTSQYSIIESGKSWKCDCKNNPSYDSISSKIPSSLEATLSLSREINKIKKEFNTAQTNEQLVKYLIDDIFKQPSKFATLNTFHKKHDGKVDYMQWQKTLKNELEQLISGSNPQANPNNLVTQAPSSPKSIIQSNPNDSNVSGDIKTPAITFEIDVIALVLITAMGIVLYKLYYKVAPQKSSQNKTEISTNLKNYINEKINDIKFQKPLGQTVNNPVEINRLKDELSELKRQIAEINEKNSTENISNKESFSSPNNSVSNFKTQTEILFLSQPNEDSSFDASYATSDYRKSASIFKFTKTNPTTAIFQIDDQESSIEMAMKYRQKTILPVCDSENEFEPKHTRLRTIEQGKAKLEGDKWKVIQKARIRYEN